MSAGYPDVRGFSLFEPVFLRRYKSEIGGAYDPPGLPCLGVCQSR